MPGQCIHSNKQESNKLSWFQRPSAWENIAVVSLYLGLYSDTIANLMGALAGKTGLTFFLRTHPHRES